jgi:hypothetical protein
MANDTEIIENVPDVAPKPRRVSREFVMIVAFIVVIAAGALGFRGWQYLQTAPDLSYAMDFIRSNLEAPVAPHLERAAMNGQVAAFYKENGPVESVLSHKLDSRGESPFGDAVYTTKTEVKTKHGPVLVRIKVKNHQGVRSIVSMVYEPES